MGWYKNQKARHEAHKAGEPRPLTGGIGDRIGAHIDGKLAALEVKQTELAAAKADRDAAK